MWGTTVLTTHLVNLSHHTRRKDDCFLPDSTPWPQRTTCSSISLTNSDTVLGLQSLCHIPFRAWAGRTTQNKCTPRHAAAFLLESDPPRLPSQSALISLFGGNVLEPHRGLE